MISLFYFGLGFWFGILLCAGSVFAYIYFTEGRQRDRV
jgi:hypothetical protein